MTERDKINKEILECKNPELIVEEYMASSDHVSRFKNIFNFMDRCKALGVTPENSITFYSEEEGCMYIKYPYIACY